MLAQPAFPTWDTCVSNNHMVRWRHGEEYASTAAAYHKCTGYMTGNGSITWVEHQMGGHNQHAV
jgi:hypothetical protein